PKPPTPADLPPAALDLATKLFNLARQGQTPLLSAYLTAGIPPNLTNSTGDTLLMLAAYHGHASTVSMLLSQGADPNVLNDRGQSPLAGAVFKGWDDVVRALWEAGADMRLGRPTAVEAARMFRREGVLGLFGVEAGSSMPWMDGE
ncbi:ankyrin, partial [Delitschia confertaspora ATCC 74209]